MKDGRYIEFVVVPNKRPRKKIVLIAAVAVVSILVLVVSGVLVYNAFFRIPERDRTFYKTESIVDKSDVGYFSWNTFWVKTHDSKKIKVIGYDYEQKCLMVCYNDRDIFDIYLHISEKEWNNIISANNLDKYFDKNVKENYIHSVSKIKCKITGWEGGLQG